MATTSEADKVAYCNCMEQVKRRLRLIRLETTGGIRTGDEGADAEFACLQVRRALELTAFATLAANRERYSQIRADVENEWRAKRILDRLKQLHPDFYPVPVSPNRVGPGRWHFSEITDGYLTQDEFVELYDKCSDVLHEWNPFRPGRRQERTASAGLVSLLVADRHPRGGCSRWSFWFSSPISRPSART